MTVDGVLPGCDTVVALPNTTKEGQTILAKSSDRPIEECQPLVQVDRRDHPRGTTIRLPCQGIELVQAASTHRHVGSRNHWGWGYEHGFNEHQVAIGEEALWSRLPEFQKPKLLGTDLVRLGLERGRTAAEAADVMTALITRYGQGTFKIDEGEPCAAGIYDNGFIVADPIEAYVIETAGHEWVVKKVESSIGISNIHSVGTDWDRLSPAAQDYACQQGWWETARGRFDFAEAYGRDPSQMPFNPRGAKRRERSCALLSQSEGKIDVETIFALLRDHADGRNAEDLFRSDHHTTASLCWHHTEEMPGNTAASLVADLCADGSRLPVYWCSFYSPCVSVFQPVFIEGQIPPMLAIGGAEAGTKSPWWLFRGLEAVVRKDTTGDAATAVRAAWKKFEAELRITAYEIAGEAKKMMDRGQSIQASRMLTEYMNRNLDKTLSTLRGFLS